MAGTVTVFGGSGFIGRYVVQGLARDGWTIRVAVRHPGRAKFLRPLGDLGQITPLCVPLQDAEAVAAAVAGSDAVVNLVGILVQSGRQRFQTVQAEGAGTVASAAAAAGVEALVHISAIGASPDVDSAYARSKAEGEVAVRAAFPEAAILRPSVVFGPEDDFFNRFAEMTRFSPVLPLIGGGRTRFQPVYVGDVAQAAVKALSDPACRGKVYELGGPKVYSLAEIMALLLRTIGRKRALVNLPFGLAGLQAGLLELLPKPLLTRDQVSLLRHDNVVSPGALGLKDLGIEATAPEAVIASYLDRYRPGGRFGRVRA